MNAPTSPAATSERKAALARQRSPLEWPDVPFLQWAEAVRFEARVALRAAVTDSWRSYRSSRDPATRAKLRSYLRAKIAALRFFAVCV